MLVPFKQFLINQRDETNNDNAWVQFIFIHLLNEDSKKFTERHKTHLKIHQYFIAIYESINLISQRTSLALIHEQNSPENEN